ncbi:SGNH/GDSL hydrolase family protein [Thermoflexibacter ruber]|uniref:Lysophospholipase L1 n=1 Tax=Thermoflexibacter ruber TaxID=1003 RepID=A0A1I2IRP6_9BACT|nr:SGNH/GDSL hydrolase family protein [Thermoflexibacter ruber]SFF43486.1 Lysophospholipase L1 [Thermoflexibacter ruber]
MKYALVLLLLLFGNCMVEQKNEGKQFTYLALGDSYTIGESVKEEERYPVMLAKELNQAKIPINNPDIIARTGWTTDELLSAIEKKNPPNTYDLVSLLIGVNNQYRGYSVDTYHKEFEILLKIAIEKAQGNKNRVFVLSIPDYGVTPFAQNSDTAKIAHEIDIFNNINREISQLYGVKYFDITPISRKAKDNAQLIAKDGLHPSGLMYKEWVTLILNDVRAMF